MMDVDPPAPDEMELAVVAHGNMVGHAAQRTRMKDARADREALQESIEPVCAHVCLDRDRDRTINQLYRTERNPSSGRPAYIDAVGRYFHRRSFKKKERVMSRVPLINPATAEGDRKVLLDQIQGAFGATPAMFRAVANSPAALKSMFGSFGALGSGSLPAKLGEQLAVAIANRNACEYCLAAHTALGRKAGATAEEISDAQDGRSKDPQTAAALAFALKLVEERGQVTDADVTALRAAGFSDEQIVEIIAHVALNLFTNYVNVALDVPVDFPAVKLRKVA